MAHGGKPDWNKGVLSAIKPLENEMKIEVSFGMADAFSIQEAVQKLEARGVRKIAVVRLFISGESWLNRTRQIIGLDAGAPKRAIPVKHTTKHHKTSHTSHRMEFWKIKTISTFSLSTQGLAEAKTMNAVLAHRVKILSKNPKKEDVLVLAHGPADDQENNRWLSYISARTKSINKLLPFHRVKAMTLREDWPDKRKIATQDIRAFVKRASDEGRKAIIIPYRTHGFGPYAKVLKGLDYISDGLGLIPHKNVTQWIREQATQLSRGSFTLPLE